MAEQPELKKYDNPQDAVDDLQKALNEAFPEGRWMVAIWSVGGSEGDKRVRYVGKWTWMFPTGDYLKAVFWLMKDLFDEIVGLDDKKPKLQLASFLGGPSPPASVSEATGEAGPPPLSLMNDKTEKTTAQPTKPDAEEDGDW